MSKYKKSKEAAHYNEAVKFIDDWKAGKSCKFKPGDVIERGNGTLAVVQFATAKYGEYSIKCQISSNPWEFVEGIGTESQMKKSDKPSPFIYKYSEMIPGPSSNEIDRLNKKMEKYDAVKTAELTSKEIDRRLAAYEECLAHKKELRKTEEEIDKIVPDDEEDDFVIATEIDPIAEKREKIISED